MESNSDKSSFIYYDSIDVLRFLLVSIVIAAHTGFWGPYDIARVAVKCFFVISGFLITERLIKQKDNIVDLNSLFYQYSTFAIKRIFRIFPIYYLCLIFVKIFSAYSFDWATLIKWDFSYLGNFHVLHIKSWPGMYSHLWTLGIEEQFYIFWPFLIFFTPTTLLIYLCIGIISIGLFTRAFFDFMAFENHALWSHVFTLSVIDLFGIGALLSLFYVKLLKIKRSKIGLISFVIICFLIVTYYFAYNNVSHPDFFFLPFVVGLLSATSILILMLFNEKFTSPVWSPFKYFGKISYGIYLYHNFIIGFLVELFDKLDRRYGVKYPQGFVLFILVLILSIIVSHYSWKIIESPMNSMKEKILAIRAKRPRTYVKNNF